MKRTVKRMPKVRIRVAVMKGMTVMMMSVMTNTTNYSHD